jgi:hypothetical protein
MKITAPSANHDALGGVSTSDHHTKYSDANAIAAVVEDAAYGSGWNGDTSHAPSQNALYDKINSISEPVQADQAAIEGETNQDTYIPPDLMKHHPGVAKAWCSITAAGVLSAPDYGIATIGDSGTGDRDINFTTAFSTAVYAIAATQLSPTTSGDKVNQFLSPTTADVRLICRQTDESTMVDLVTTQVFFGDFA